MFQSIQWPMTLGEERLNNLSVRHLQHDLAVQLLALD